MGDRKKAESIVNLVKHDWSANQLKAILLLANPRGMTQRKMAAKIGVREQTISEWKNLEGFMDDVHRVATVCFLEADLQVDRAMLKAAIGYEVEFVVRKKNGEPILDEKGKPLKETTYIPPDTKAAELYYKRRGLITDKKPPTGHEDDPIHYAIRYANADDNGK
jgi:transcriptional regulator with XRE-family HTH domain